MSRYVVQELGDLGEVERNASLDLLHLEVEREWLMIRVYSNSEGSLKQFLTVFHNLLVLDWDIYQLYALGIDFLPILTY